ncbi:MAG: hypothetical protein E4H36_10900 [Spirochaetales bacterium]|nr:MAG: hypothetical protein E4H36_10900 [Spirochaetales bacterium]
MNQNTRTAASLLLFSRVLLFLVFQSLIALIFLLIGNNRPWYASEGWWMSSVTLTNVVMFALIVSLLRKEGKKYFEVFRFTREGWWKDLLIALGIFAVAAPVSTFPNLWLAKLLFGASDATVPMLFRALPVWGLILSILFPLTQVFVELPLYFGYIMPRLTKPSGKGWPAWVVASFFLGFQHVAVPFIPDVRFMASST